MALRYLFLCRLGVSVEKTHMGSYYTYGISLTVLESLNWLQEFFRPPVRLSHPETMTNIAREATAMSRGKNVFVVPEDL